MTEKTIDMFAGYRKNYSVPHPAAQLVLPEGLKEFGLYMLGLLKTRAFKGRSDAGVSHIPFYSVIFSSSNGFRCRDIVFVHIR